MFLLTHTVYSGGFPIDRIRDHTHTHITPFPHFLSPLSC